MACIPYDQEPFKRNTLSAISACHHSCWLLTCHEIRVLFRKYLLSAVLTERRDTTKKWIRIKIHDDKYSNVYRSHGKSISPADDGRAKGHIVQHAGLLPVPPLYELDVETYNRCRKRGCRSLLRRWIHSTRISYSGRLRCRLPGTVSCRLLQGE